MLSSRSESDAYSKSGSDAEKEEDIDKKKKKKSKLSNFRELVKQELKKEQPINLFAAPYI